VGARVRERKGGVRPPRATFRGMPRPRFVLDRTWGRQLARQRGCKRPGDWRRRMRAFYHGIIGFFGPAKPVVDGRMLPFPCLGGAWSLLRASRPSFFWFLRPRWRVTRMRCLSKARRDMKSGYLPVNFSSNRFAPLLYGGREGGRGRGRG
jgi:hypothetical protein